MRRPWQVPPLATPPTAEPPPLSPYSALGTQPCNGMGCSSPTGMGCAYVDRRGRSCPTAWCPNHRTVLNGTIYCALHGATVGGLQSDYGDFIHPDLDNGMPALVAWVARLAEDDVVATLRSICRERDEVLVSDAVRRVLIGVERTRTWERSWKVCSVVGVSARVAIAVEDANPTTVLAKVNSKVVASVAIRPEAVGSPPHSVEVENLFRALVMPMAMALDVWQQGTTLHADVVGRRPASPPPAPS